jgi:transposase
VGRPGVARHQKKAADRGASLVFSDESGFLLLPLVRRTLAPCGRAAPLAHRAGHRDKVSVAAALTLSPCRGHVNLYYQTYPGGYVNVEAYARFLRGMLWRMDHPVVLVHDRGNMHRGDPVRELMSDFPRRIDLNLLPPYAPELNPVEQLWNFAKDKELSNFVPHDVAEANAGVTRLMDRVRHDQHRLRSFYRATPLEWDPLTVFI